MTEQSKWKCCKQCGWEGLNRRYTADGLPRCPSCGGAVYRISKNWEGEDMHAKIRAQRDEALFALSALMSEVEGIMPIDSDSKLAQAYDAAHEVREKLFQS